LSGASKVMIRLTRELGWGWMVRALAQLFIEHAGEVTKPMPKLA
jgi:hypothetical protein